MSIDVYFEATDGDALEKAEAERWKATSPSFGTLIEAFLYASRRLYPIATANLKRLMTLPVTNAEAVRSFSALKRLKTYFRSTMDENRLTGLALLAVHNVTNSIDEVIKKILLRIAC